MSITNPLTGRRIKEGGKTHRSLQMGGVLTDEERAFIARNNKKAQFKRAIQALPQQDRPGYEVNLEDPNFAEHLRDAQSDIEIYRKRRQMGGVLTDEERAFIARNNKKAQFKRAIQALPPNERPGYEVNLDNPNFAEHLRDAQSDIEIHRKRRQHGAGLFGSQKYMIDDNMYRKLSDLVDKATGGFTLNMDPVIDALPEGSKLKKEGRKLMQTNADYFNKILMHAEARMLQ